MSEIMGWRMFQTLGVGLINTAEVDTPYGKGFVHYNGVKPEFEWDGELLKVTCPHREWKIVIDLPDGTTTRVIVPPLEGGAMAEVEDALEVD